MIYDVAFAVDAEKDLRKAILSRVTDYEIYSYYLGHAFQIGKAMSSPFRTDNKPSFSIYKDKFYNGLLHKDFGDARYVGDCFSFVEQSFPGTTYKDAMYRVVKDILYGKLKKHIGYIDRKPTEKTTKVKCVLQYVPLGNVPKNVKSYWDDIGVTEEWRNFFRIYDAESLYVDEVRSWQSTPENPIFVYKIFDKIKGYRPLEENKSRKWISNCSRYDIQGWEQLPEINDTETLIITKSLKDVAVLRTMGYLAIAPPAESIMIPPIAMRLLSNKYGFKRFILLYDRDHAGMMGTKKMFTAYRGTYSISFKFIGRGHPKDIADFRRSYGESTTQRYLFYLLGYGPNEKLRVLSTNASQTIA